MKKVLLAAILLWAAIFLTGSNAALAAPTVTERTVTVTGHGELTVAPDMAYVTLGIMTSADEAKTAMQENSQAVNRVVEALLAQGISREQIKTSLVSLYPVFPQPGQQDAQTAATGYRAQNNVTITVNDLANVGRVLDTALGAGANQMQGVRFAVKDDSKLQDEVMKKAIQDGQHKAAVLAQNLGGKLGPVQTINESGRAYPVYTSGAVMKSDAAGVPVYGGVMTYTADINVTYTLE